jgi:hypothetical protein
MRIHLCGRRPAPTPGPSQSGNERPVRTVRADEAVILGLAHRKEDLTMVRTSDARRRRRPQPLAALSLFVTLLVHPVAPSMAAEAASAREQPASTAVDDDLLRRFAAATRGVDRVTRSWSVRAHGAETEADLHDVERDAQRQIAAVVRAEGLTVAEYSSIFQLLRSDHLVNAEVQRLIRERVER